MKLVLLGKSYYTNQIRPLLEACSSTNIIAEISSLKQITTISNITQDVSVVCCLLGEQEQQAFLEAMRYCHENKLSFLHPAFVLQGVEFPLSKTPKIRTYGFPGSGNMLLVDFILSHLPSQKRSELENIYWLLGRHYNKMIHATIENALQATIELVFNAESTVMYSITEDYVGMLRAYHNAKRQFLIHGFPLPAFTKDATVGCHGFLSHGTIDFYDAKKFSQVLIIRHPLDTIFSNLKKLKSIGEEYNYENVESLTKYYSDFMQVALTNKHKVYIIKYEDLLSDTLNVLKNFSEYCKLDVSDNAIIKWKNKKLFKLLPRTTGTHFQGGGIGKWQSFFDKRCFEILERNGIFNIIDKLGYTLPNVTMQASNIAPYQEHATEIAKNHLSLYYHPYWNIKNGYQCLSTPHNRTLYYKFYGDAVEMQETFEANTLLLKLMVDSFYAHKSISMAMPKVKKVFWKQLVPYRIREYLYRYM